MDTLFPPSRSKRMTELGDKQKFTICANLCEFNATLFAFDVSEYGSRGGLAPSVERVCPCPCPWFVLTCMSCAREQRPPLNFDRPKPGRPSAPASTLHAQPNFAINFPTFNKIRKRNSFFFSFSFFLPLEFFNCHKFILIQREIYEWQIEFENWVIFFLSFYIGNLGVPEIAILK